MAGLDPATQGYKRQLSQVTLDGRIVSGQDGGGGIPAFNLIEAHH
jgi:hypothetical protein